MPAYYNKKNNTWFTKFTYKNYYGERKHTTKRGFKTKEEAIDYENQFKDLIKDNKLYLPFEVFVQEYFKDKINNLKETTIQNKRNCYDKYIIPFFKGRELSNIHPKDVKEWINELNNTNNHNNKPFSTQFINSLISELRRLFKYATIKYNLKDNPTSGIKLYKRQNKDINYLTIAEYKNFSQYLDKNKIYYYLFECLYYLGIKETELLALTLDDIDFNNKYISINKFYINKKNNRNLKTLANREARIRKVKIPDFLVKELLFYYKEVRKYYIKSVKDKNVLFPISRTPFVKFMKNLTKQYDLKPLKFGDLRHSNAYYLINAGYDSCDIAKRIGLKHNTFLNKYGFMFEEKDKNNHYIKLEEINISNKKQIKPNQNINNIPKKINIKKLSILGIILLILYKKIIK